MPRRLLIHADDAGLCHAENRATVAVLEAGMVNSYSLMVPCPGFGEMVGFAKAHPEYDCGVHLTMTCEWETFRFGPVAPVSAVPSLVDERGHFLKKRHLLAAVGKAEEVRIELKAQIDRVLELGIRPTHLDSHMYSVAAHPAYFEVYRALGKEYDLPVLMNAEMLEAVGLDPEKQLRPEDFTVDKAHIGNYDLFSAGQLRDHYFDVIDNLVEGNNILLLHPAYDDAEMREVAVNHPNFGSAWRQIDLDVFTSAEMRAKIAASGVELVTWAQLARG